MQPVQANTPLKRQESSVWPLGSPARHLPPRKLGGRLLLLCLSESAFFLCLSLSLSLFLCLYYLCLCICSATRWSLWTSRLMLKYLSQMSLSLSLPLVLLWFLPSYSSLRFKLPPRQLDCPSLVQNDKYLADMYLYLYLSLSLFLSLYLSF